MEAVVAVLLALAFVFGGSAAWAMASGDGSTATRDARRAIVAAVGCLIVWVVTR